MIDKNNLIIKEASFKIVTPLKCLKEYPILIEKWGRKCYKSEHLIKTGSASKFIKKIIKNKHLSVIEHLTITVDVICSRSCSHQLVRHRLGSYSQESQRYTNYKKRGYEVICPFSIINKNAEECIKKFDKNKDIVKSFYINSKYEDWIQTILMGIKRYEDLLSQRIKPEDARSVLPNAMKTEIVTTYNLREWRHVFEERALNLHAQLEIRELMQSILTKFSELLPDFFEDQLEQLNKMKKEK